MPADRLRVGARGGRAASERGLDTGERPFRVDPARLGQKNGELVAAGPVRAVGRTEGLAEQVGDLDEEAVCFELTDVEVRQLEVVEVEHANGQPASPATCPRDLQREGLVEHLPVAQPR